MAEALRCYRCGQSLATLSLLEELSYQEIAAVLACPVGTVRSRLHRARRLLQAALWQVAQAYGLV